jgi:hypothetical protein
MNGGANRQETGRDMTRVQIHFRLPNKLDDAGMARLSDARSVYGIQRMQVGAGLDSMVE